MADIILYYTSGGSDKEYRAQLSGTAGLLNWEVAFQYGRRGNANAGGYKIRGAESGKARRVFESLIREKVGKGYTLNVSGTPYSTTIEEAIAVSQRGVVRIQGTQNRQDAPVIPYQGDPVMRDAEESLGVQFQQGRSPTPEESSLHTGNRDKDLGSPPEVERQFTVVGSRRVTWAGRKVTQTIPEPPTPEAMPAFSELPNLITLPEDLIAPLHSQQPTVIEESAVEALLSDDAWGLQDKYDGKKITVRVKNGQGQAFNKKGQPVAIPQQIMTDILTCGKDLEIDGELIGTKYIVYDLLSFDRDFRSETYRTRHGRIPRVAYNCSFGPSITVAPLYVGTEAKRARYNEIQSLGGEGVILKRLDAPFTAGKAHGTMFKYKFYATASCIVMAGREGKRSIGLGLVGFGSDLNQVVSVGNCTIPNKVVDRELIPTPPVGSVVEIRYLYAYPGGSLYQPTYIGPRCDVSVDECLMQQLKYKQEVDNG
jgi:bifunctional non-homologous end joining protein LigD